MWPVPDRHFGIAVMALFALQGAFVLLTPGSLRLQRPEGGGVAWFYNSLNLATLLVLTPVAAVCLMRGWSAPLEWTGFEAPPRVAAVLRAGGLVVYALGNVVMYWARVLMGRSFRLGAVPPGESDRLVVRGPFRWVRHPMYTAVVLMALGLGTALQSFVFLAAAFGLLQAIVRLVPIEEAQLLAGYGEDYRAYASRTKRLLPGVY